MDDGRAGRHRSRRRYLASLGSGTLAGLAGCGTFTGGETATSTDDGAPSRTRTPASGTLDPADYGPPGEGEWERTMVDYFDGGELDDSLWSLGFGHHDGTHCAGDNGRRFCWSEDHVAVDDETNRLRLRVSDEPPPPDEQEPADAEPGYTAGAVTTAGNFAQEFGYFEAAARVPDEPGTLPACWLMLDQFEHAWREIELYEKPGATDADTLRMGGWVDTAEGKEGWRGDLEFFAADGAEGDVGVPGPVDESFHVVGLEWTPERLTWYVNGDAVGRVENDLVAYLPGEELHWICNSAVFEGAEWVGYPTLADFPHYHEFEWVRTWQRQEWAEARSDFS